MNVSNPPGQDGIPPIVLKMLELSPILRRLFLFLTKLLALLHGRAQLFFLLHNMETLLTPTTTTHTSVISSL